MMILTIFLIVAVVCYFRHRRDQMIHETTRSMIEKGVPVTPEVIAELRASVRSREYHRRSFRIGLILTAVGTALLISHHHEGGGWIVLLIGVAYLIVWLLEGKDIDASQPPKP